MQVFLSSKALPTTWEKVGLSWSSKESAAGKWSSNWAPVWATDPAQSYRWPQKPLREGDTPTFHKAFWGQPLGGPRDNSTRRTPAAPQTLCPSGLVNILEDVHQSITVEAMNRYSLGGMCMCFCNILLTASRCLLTFIYFNCFLFLDPLHQRNK